MKKYQLNENDLNRKHEMLWHGVCYHCICRMCNMHHCRYRTHFELCLSCLQRGNSALKDCDGFESRYYLRVFRVKKELVASKRPSVRQMIEEIYRSGKWK